MALDAKKVYALCKKYTDDSVAGGGTIKGKNCVINSITPITGGNQIEFQWTLDNGTVQTDTLDVMNGVNGTNGTDGTDGVGIASITFKAKDVDGSNIYTITYTDGDTEDIVCPIGPAGANGADGKDGTDGVGVPDGGTTGQVLKKKSNTNYDTEWADESGGGTEHGIPDGGTANQILAKNSNTDYDVHWVDPSASSQVQSDWDQTNTSAVDYIKHKPDNLVQDANYVHTDNNYTDTDKGIVASVTTDLAGKADKVAGATNGNFAILDSNGNLADSLKSPSSYYLKTETYTQAEVNALIGAISTISIIYVNALPTTDIKTNVIYLVPKSVGTGVSNIKDEYINIDGTTAGWEKIGETEIDLSNYIQMSSTAGLVKNDGSIDTNTYLTASDISGKQNTITISGKKVMI